MSLHDGPTDRDAAAAAPEEMWTLSADRRNIQMVVPDLSVMGLPDPLRIQLNFDAQTVDAVLTRLAELRVQMQPPPRRH